MVVQLRPLSIGVFQLIMRAAREDPGLIPVLMIKESLVKPVMSVEQVNQLHLGVVSFLIDQVRAISGLVEKKTLLGESGASPWIAAYYRMARAFGWTPQQTQELTMAQIAILVEMLERESE